ncbi:MULTISPECIES: hypothetical protein [Olivibacter]|uniref:Uncharacterized protein n=1 Tax=Olivibacter jilunii TaxID=985016 RepID=A0ABW6B175_9SPHI
MKESIQNTKLTPEKLAKVLKNGKNELERDEAAKVLFFLRKLARVVVRKYLEI